MLGLENKLYMSSWYTQTSGTGVGVSVGTGVFVGATVGASVGAGVLVGATVGASVGTGVFVGASTEPVGAGVASTFAVGVPVSVVPVGAGVSLAVPVGAGACVCVGAFVGVFTPMSMASHPQAIVMMIKSVAMIVTNFFISLVSFLCLVMHYNIDCVIKHFIFH
jgi:hypothetical protein